MPGEGTRDTIPRSALNVVIVSSDGGGGGGEGGRGCIVRDVEEPGTVGIFYQAEQIF